MKRSDYDDILLVKMHPRFVHLDVLEAEDARR